MYHFENVYARFSWKERRMLAQIPKDKVTVGARKGTFKICLCLAIAPGGPVMMLQS